MSQTVISVADACKELAKPVIDTACGLINSLLGKPCEIAGEMISDELYRWQWEQRITILDKADQKIKKRGIATKLLPKGFFLTFLASAGQVEASELQELWATLLAKSLEDEAHQHPAFVQVLKQLSVAEALILAVLGEGSFKYIQKVITQHPSNSITTEFEIIPATPLERKAVMISLSHLSELGLITVQTRKNNTHRAVEHQMVESETGMTAFTTFGAAFFDACMSEDGTKPKPIVDGWTIMHKVWDAAMEAGRTASSAHAAAERGMTLT